MDRMDKRFLDRMNRIDRTNKCTLSNFVHSVHSGNYSAYALDIMQNKAVS
jgi:hypothetical protein